MGESSAPDCFHTTYGNLTGLLCSHRTWQRALWGAEGEHWNWSASGTIHTHHRLKAIIPAGLIACSYRLVYSTDPVQTRMTHLLRLLNTCSSEMRLVTSFTFIMKSSFSKRYCQPSPGESPEFSAKPGEIQRNIFKDIWTAQCFTKCQVSSCETFPAGLNIQCTIEKTSKRQFSPKTRACTFISV